MIDFKELARRYEEVRPRYERLCSVIEGSVRSALLDRAIPHSLQGRVKGLASLLRKALDRRYADPLADAPDMVGLRIVLPFVGLRGDAIEAVEQRFEVVGYEDKASQYEPNVLGYLGHHLNIRLRAEDVRGAGADVAGLVAEVQVHTRAESAWAEASHDLTYKKAMKLPQAVERRIQRLLALVELFDDQMARAQQELLDLPGFPPPACCRSSIATTFHSLAASTTVNSR